MLTAIRSKASSWVVKGLFVVLVASFAVWGIGDIFRAPTISSPAIQVGEVSISGEAVSVEVRRAMDRFQDAFRTQIDMEQARAMGFVDSAMQGLISRSLLQEEARRLGMLVPDSMIQAQIAAAFTNEQGQIDREAFARYLQGQQQSEGRFVATLRAQIAEAQLMGPLAAGTAAPKAMLDEIHAHRAQTRIAKTLLLPPSVAGTIADPADEVLKAYYDEHADAFMAPEYRTLVLVLLSEAEVAKSITLTDERLRQEFETRKNELALPEHRQVQQIVVPDEATAKAVAERAKSEPLDAVGTGTPGATFSDLGSVAAGGLLPELSAPVFGAAEGAVVGPIESKLGDTSLGWYVLKVGKIEPGRPRTFEETKEELRAQITKDQAASEMVSMANGLDDAIAGGASLEDAAAKLTLPVQKIGAVDRTGMAPDGSPVAPLAGNGVLLAMAFETPQGETTSQQPLDDGSQAILRVDGVQQAAPRPFEEVRPTVLEAWRKAEQDKALAAKAESLAQEVRGGKSLETLAMELRLAVRTSQPFQRTAGDPPNDIGGTLTGKLFGVKPNEVATAPAEGGYVLAQLVEIRAAEPLKPEEKTALEGEVRQQLYSDIRQQFVGALQQDIEVTTDPAVIEQLF